MLINIYNKQFRKMVESCIISYTDTVKKVFIFTLSFKLFRFIVNCYNIPKGSVLSTTINGIQR